MKKNINFKVHHISPGNECETDGERGRLPNRNVGEITITVGPNEIRYEESGLI
jgi:hypothetical protein